MDSSTLLLQEYKGAVDGKICSICKLELRRKQKIIQCPFCEYLFHKEHLFEWLETNKDCPVCNRLVSYDISENDFSERKVNEESLSYPGASIIFRNQYFPKRNFYYTMRVILFVFGLLSIVITIYGFISFITKIGMQGLEVFWLGGLISPFVLIGFALMIIPNLKVFRFKYNWKSLILTEDGILIEGRKLLRVIKINPKTIHSIELQQYFGSKINYKYSRGFSNINSELQFHIKILLNLMDKKHYYIKSICQIFSEQASNKIYQSLKLLIFQRYNIEVITPFITKRR